MMVFKFRGIKLFFLLALCCAVWLRCGSSDSSVNNDDNGKEPVYDSLIAYVSSDGISVIKTNGTGKIPLVIDFSDSLMSPVWSPDKSRIAFVRIRTVGEGDLVRYVSYPGGTVTDMKIGSISSDPWSPNGSRLAYTRNDSVFYIAVGTSVENYILEHAKEACFLTNDTVICQFSPSDDMDSTVIAKIAINGTGLVTLTSIAGATNFLPRLSPSRNIITYARTLYSYFSDNNEVWVMSKNGSGQIKIGTCGTGQLANGRIREIEFSENNEQVLVSPDNDDLTQVYIIDISNYSVTPINSAKCEDRSRSFSCSPDQAALVFWLTGGGIAIINFDGTGLDTLDTEGAYPNW